MRTTNRTLLWAFIAIAVVVNIAGYALNLYQRLWWFDEVNHTYTNFVIVYIVGLYLYGIVLVGAGRHPLLFILTVAAIGLGLGALWEIGEWIFDLVVPGNLIKGKPDTMIDLIADTVGALAAGGLIWMIRRDGATLQNNQLL